MHCKSSTYKHENEIRKLFRVLKYPRSVHVLQFRVRQCQFRVLTLIHEPCFEATKRHEP